MVQTNLYWDEEHGYVGIDDFYERNVDIEPFIADGTVEFHIGQVYDDEPAQSLACEHCGNNSFHVGVGGYYTAIKCTECEWEARLHDG